MRKDYSHDNELSHTANRTETLDPIRLGSINESNLGGYVNSSFSNQGRGGMQSKLDAAEIAQKHGIDSWIINGHENNFLLNAINESVHFSRIKPLQNCT